ncbi:SctD/MshK family protein [Pseudomonas huanghezhanensis]|uniref:SctD/MshK family protein n=1 Tax=Pseudomonas huanghezhanensis TaxID=3002903 RepID=UPI0022853C2E|nr:FHA domain-containing protein [Pseudomonas sp. BSw22131]
MTALIFLTSAPGSSAPGKSIPLLSVTRGLHQGVTLPLDKAAYVIGSAEHADLLISDPGIAERHMALRFSSGQVAVEALGGDVTVIARNGQAINIPVGSGHRARLPLDIRLGDARLTLTDPAQPQVPVEGGVPVWRRKPQWILALLLMFLCVGAFAFRGQPASPAGSVLREDMATSSPVPNPPAATSEEARVWLEQQLTASSLNQIKVSEIDGQLSAQGSYDPAKKGQWVSVQQAYDARFGQQVVLHQSVAPRTEIAKPRVRFQAVWFGANPYVVNESGKRLYPGAALADDWMLERIENNQVILARGEDRFTFTL